MTMPYARGWRWGNAAAWALGSVVAAATAWATPEYWVDNEWIRVIEEERRESPIGITLAIHAECMQQGFPEYVVSHLGDDGSVLATEKSGKYCPGAGARIVFLLPLPSGAYRIEFNRLEGAM